MHVHVLHFHVQHLRPLLLICLRDCRVVCKPSSSRKISTLNAILILFPYLMHLPRFSLFQVCDSDTVLDPACTIEMLKILEDDPMVGGVGGDVQVKSAFQRDQT